MKLASESSTAVFSENALTVLRERYLRRDERGNSVETPAEMLERVASAIAAAGRIFGDDVPYWEERFYERLTRLEFLPNSPTLMNAGLLGGQLAACFVLPLEDSLDSIFTTLGNTARIHQSGGGTGFSFSSIRPANDSVRSTGGIASGPLSFMDLFDHATAVIRQGGRRRGANMAVLRVDHPDIEAFAEAKRSPGRLENFNLSVGVTESFLAAVDGGTAFGLKNPRTGRIARAVDAVTLFERIVKAAWETGDPGLLFLDEINRHNPTPALGGIEATNPCGEQPLLPYESCTLGSINLSALSDGAGFDWEKFRGVIHDAVVFLDNVIEANSYPLPEIKAATRRTRKIGLGVMGLADMLAKNRVPYDSEQALQFGEEVASFLKIEARRASSELARERGPFPVFYNSIWPKRMVPPLRNATTTCIAPTGTISLLANTSSGIEPFFSLALKHRVLDGRVFTEINPLIVEALAPFGDSAMQAVRERGSLRKISDLPVAIRARFPVSFDISPEFHVRMQAAFQSHVDAAVSKTVNLPENAPVEVVRRVFQLARRLRLKGITVYRYGSRPGQTLSMIEEGCREDCRECAI